MMNISRIIKKDQLVSDLTNDIRHAHHSHLNLFTGHSSDKVQTPRLSYRVEVSCNWTTDDICAAIKHIQDGKTLSDIVSDIALSPLGHLVITPLSLQEKARRSRSKG